MPRPVPTGLVALVAVAAPLGAAAHAGAASAAAQERLVRRCANVERAKRGLPALRSNAVLNSAGRSHARDMARKGYFDHTDRQGRSPDDRIRARTNRFRTTGENIAAGYATAAKTCAGWMASAGHRRNILNPAYRYIGGGYASGGPYKRYWVQEFGG